MLNKPKKSSLYANVRENKANSSLTGNLGRKLPGISVTCSKPVASFQKKKKKNPCVLISLVDLVFLLYESRKLGFGFF